MRSFICLASRLRAHSLRIVYSSVSILAFAYVFAGPACAQVQADTKIQSIMRIPYSRDWRMVDGAAPAAEVAAVSVPAIRVDNAVRLQAPGVLIAANAASLPTRAMISSAMISLPLQHGAAYSVSSITPRFDGFREPVAGSNSRSRPAASATALNRGAAQWILRQAIGQDGIQDLQRGLQMARRVVLLRP